MQYATAQQVKVRGDWMPDGESYPALVTGSWNGWATPTFDRETAERVVADQTAMLAEIENPEDYSLKFVEDDVLVTEPEGEEWFVQPDEDGRYDLSLGWTWFVPDENPGDDIAAPSEAQKATLATIQSQIPSWPSEERPISVFSGDRIVNDDGSHTFILHALTGREESMIHTGQCGRITIQRDGQITVPSQASATLEMDGLNVRCRIDQTENGPCLRIEALNCDLEGEQPGEYYLRPL